MTQTKEKTITVSKLQHRQNQRSGFISYCCELRVGRTCYASIEQEGNGGDERVDWNSTENYLFIHHWILNTQKEFYKDYQYECLNYYSKEQRNKEVYEFNELFKEGGKWDKAAKRKPKTAL